MSLLRVDWNPNDKKIRQFGAGIVIFAIVSAFLTRRHEPSAGPYILKGGIALGLLTALWPSFGRFIYKAWMGVAFVVGGVMSFVMLAVFYYAVLTPLALFLRLRGRDGLGLIKPAAETYWTPLVPPNNAYYDRLF